MAKALLHVRNFCCAMVALALIASGRVRRARKRALSGDCITALYFHKPNARLFRRCVRWLSEHGYVFISANDLTGILCHGRPAPKGAVWLSFDDACKQLLDSVLPLTAANRIPVTLFVPSAIVAGDGLFPWIDRSARARARERDCLTVAQLMEIAKWPEVTIGGHTARHLVTTRCPDEQVEFELADSKRALESWTGAAVTHFAYPNGEYDGRERKYLLRAGYRLAATTANAFVTSRTDPYLVPRFSIGDDIWFPEAVCNMVGVWRPVIDRIKGWFPRRVAAYLRPASMPGQSR